MLRVHVSILLASAIWVGMTSKSVAAPAPSSPATGDTWAVGSQHRVIWTSTDLASDAKIRLDFSADGGKTWSEIVATAPNTGQFVWRIPNAMTLEGRVRLSTGGTSEVSESFAVIPSQARSYRWKNITTKAAFAPRDGAGALVFRDKLWFLGGWNPGDKKHFPRICNNEVWSSADGANWVLEKPNTFLDRTFDSGKDWEGRHTAGYAVFKDRMWIVGGDVNQGHYHNDVWSSADGKKWDFVNAGRPVPWGPRALHYTCVHKDRLWVIGGQTVPGFAPSAEAFYRDIWSSSDGISWEKSKPKEPYWPQRGMIGGSAVFKDRIWILGGGTYETPKVPERKFFNDVWSSADGVSWTKHLGLAPWEARQYHDVAVFDDRLWVLEGYAAASGNRKDVWYSADGANWYEVPATPWKPRHAASVFTFKNGLWMVAGNNMESDVWKLERE